MDSGVDALNKLQRVLHLFQTSENIDTYHLNLANIMNEWSTHMSLEIDGSVYLTKSRLEVL